ncbi:hypothetical protein CDL12_25265 [Handroanthus impetiginosus]|uniref:Mitochondrial transcription termination factor, mTERF n=1 Tax=Handroanthus impetiginosus TaxID=429701 RepID=A0A2G9GAH3_9LAMI|nr:hypothetical protein CDL12_25265 [Handroanthus impetiginosus]
MLGKSLASPLLTFDSTVRSCSYLPLFDQSKPDLNQIRMPDSASVATSKLLINVNPAIFALPYALRVNRVTTCRNWEHALSAYGFANYEQDKILGKAFGQFHSPYWGEERKKEVPKFEIVIEILSYLKDLSLTDDDLSKLLKKFPEVLGCSLENELKPNVQILEKEWGIKGKTLRNLLLRNPKVLGYNIDCKGDCMAQCTRCWARF